MNYGNKIWLPQFVFIQILHKRNKNYKHIFVDRKYLTRIVLTVYFLKQKIKLILLIFKKKSTIQCNMLITLFKFTMSDYYIGDLNLIFFKS